MEIFNDFSIGLFFMQFVILTLLIFLLAKYAWRPILDAVEEREKGIQNALDAAEEAKKEMQNLQANNQKLLKEAREERDAMLKEARKIKDRIISEAEEEAKFKADKIMIAAKSSIEQEKRVALADIKKQVAGLSIDIAQKVVSKDLASSSDQLSFVEKMLEEVTL